MQFHRQSFMVGIMLSFVLWNNVARAQLPPPIEDIGNLWVITIDDSRQISEKDSTDLKKRLVTLLEQEKINFDKDCFIFFISGYTPTSNKSLSSSFVRHTDVMLHHFSGCDEVCDKVKDIFLRCKFQNNYSLVSSINLFSLAKAVDYVNRKGKSDSYRDVYVLVISSDGMEDDSWNIDGRIMKENGAFQEMVSLLNRYYAHESGLGVLSKLSENTSRVPFIRAYKYQTYQSVPKCDTVKDFFKMTANDGSHISLELSDVPFCQDHVCYYYIDSIRINHKMVVLNCRFTPEEAQSILMDVQYANSFFPNRFVLYGGTQLSYIDSIYGRHYTKAAFVQPFKSSTLFMEMFYKVLLYVGITLAILVVLFILVILPNLRLLTIYVGNKKYFVKRGYSWQWNNTPIMTCALDDKTNIITLKDIQKKRVRSVSIHDAVLRENSDSLYPFCNTLLIECRKRPKYMNTNEKDIPPISSNQDIENRFSTESKHYPDWVKFVYRKTLLYFCRKKNVRLGKLLSPIMAKNYYCIGTPGPIIIRHSYLKNKHITILFEKNEE